jgi:hypothetical protein
MQCVLIVQIITAGLIQNGHYLKGIMNDRSYQVSSLQNYESKYVICNFNMMGVHPVCVCVCIHNVGYFLIHLYTTRITTDPLNRDIFNVIIVYISHMMMAQEGRNM